MKTKHLEQLDRALKWVTLTSRSAFFPDDGPPDSPGLHFYARVEHDHLSRVGFGTDQPAESLLQFDDRFGKLILHERVASAGTNRFQSGLQ